MDKCMSFTKRVSIFSTFVKKSADTLEFHGALDSVWVRSFLVESE